MYFNTNINLIRVPRVFSGSHPNEDKMNACRAYYSVIRHTITN